MEITRGGGGWPDNVYLKTWIPLRGGFSLHLEIQTRSPKTLFRTMKLPISFDDWFAMVSVATALYLFLLFGGYYSHCLAFSFSSTLPATRRRPLFRNCNFEEESIQQNRRWTQTIAHETKVQHHTSVLFYRVHDMEDHDDSISKLRVRTSPTFKKSDLVQEQQSPNEIKASITKRAGINVPLILSLFLNQFMMLTFASGLTAFYILFSGNGEQFLSEGILNWTGSWNGLQSADLDFSITPIRIMQGSLGAIPIIAFGNFIEKSDDRRFATTNFSTLYMIITLFGLRTRSQSDDKLKGEKFNVLDRLESMRSTIGEELLVRIADSFCTKTGISLTKFFYTYTAEYYNRCSLPFNGNFVRHRILWRNHVSRSHPPHANVIHLLSRSCSCVCRPSKFICSWPHIARHILTGEQDSCKHAICKRAMDGFLVSTHRGWYSSMYYISCRKFKRAPHIIILTNSIVSSSMF